MLLVFAAAIVEVRSALFATLSVLQHCAEMLQPHLVPPSPIPWLHLRPTCKIWFDFEYCGMLLVVAAAIVEVHIALLVTLSMSVPQHRSLRCHSSALLISLTTLLLLALA